MYNAAMSELLTVVQAAKLVEVSTGTIKYWIRTGRLTERRAPRSEYSLKVRPGKRVQRLLVDRQELIAATRDGIEAALRRANPDKYLLSLTDVSRKLGVKPATAWSIIDRSGVPKYPLYGNTYLIDGNELYSAMKDSRDLSIYLIEARMKGLTI
jgi:hypothetical protein